ncbi:sensor histidine kinase [Methanofollis fontis]|uniref:histidine kinase n=1 Tax=Methanofollis fontis TaxID=2052832 RepID=A0A483CSI6_9EURY|nr:HAMP domain-containing sensor histidine kinase [Methanofollis fontis]TAJ44161.1 histidine kinase [Methanofollis fontis]
MLDIKAFFSRLLKDRPLTEHLMISVIILIVLIIASLSAFSYYEAQSGLEERERLLQIETEQSIIQWMTLVDEGLKMYDDTLDLRMKDSFEGFLEAYQDSGGDPSRMNLEDLKTGLDNTMDLYIINSSGVIEYSTVAEEIGVDFSQIPEFYQYLTSIRESDNFSADRVVRESSTGAIRKFAYMPTPDHRYILELGLVPDLLKDRKLGLSYVDAAEDLKKINRNLQSIRIYDIFGKTVGNKSHVPTPLQQERIKAAIQERTGNQSYDPANKTATDYIFIDLFDPDYPSDMSLVIELTFTTAPLERSLNSIFFTHLLIALLALLISMILAFSLIRYISKPISRMVADVDQIAHGDLDHRIQHTRGVELTRLEESINAMVGTLKSSLTRAQESEEALKQTNENLEKIVEKRTADLQNANAEANLYLDIISHDINNVNTIGLGYVHILRRRLSGGDREYAEKITRTIHRSSGIIHNVATIRMIHQKRLPLQPVDLDRVIRDEIAHNPEARIHFSGCEGLKVYADSLLSEVFSNLISNSLKFMEKDGDITIRVSDEDREIMVSVEDTGPGIPDELKEVIFNRFKRGSERQTGKGLGLYIVRSLVENYGGRVWADDRIPGQQTAGAAIRFTLVRVAEKEKGRQG